MSLQKKMEEFYMKYLKNDDEIRILNTQEDLEEYLTFRKKHDEWSRGLY